MKKTHLSTAITIAMLTITSNAYAGCNDTSTNIGASSGSTCNATRTTYEGTNTAYAKDDGSVLNLKDQTTITGYANVHVLSINGNGGYGTAGATIHALGDLRVAGLSANKWYSSKEIFIASGRSATTNELNKLIVDGNLTTYHAARAASIQNHGYLEVKGNTSIEHTYDDYKYRNAFTAMRLYDESTTLLKGDLTAKEIWIGIGIKNTANLTVEGDTTLETTDGAIVADGDSKQSHKGTVRLVSSADNVNTLYIGEQAKIGIGTEVDDTKNLLMQKGNIIAQGENANAVYVKNEATTEINLSGGNIESQKGVGINLSAATGNNTVDIEGGKINAKTALLGGAGKETVNLKAGDVSATEAALSLGDEQDIVNISGGTITGALDGGDDLSSKDGWDDELNYVGYNGNAIDETQVKNFENFNIKDTSEVTFADGYNSANYLKYGIEKGSTAKYTGASTINANVTNAGVIDLTGNATVGDSLTIKKRDKVDGTNGTDGDDGSKGDFNHTGTFKTDVDFSGLTADTITAEGNFSTNKDGSLSEGLVSINNVNKATNPDKSHEIDLIVAPNDTNKDDENVNLVESQRYDGNKRQGLLGNDPYIWELKQTDHDNGKGHNWTLAYLKEKGKVIRPEIPVITSLHTIGKELAGADNEQLHTRLGELRNCGADGFCLDKEQKGLWLRTHSGKSSFDGKSSFELDGDYKGLTLGYDRRVYTDKDWALYNGVFVGMQDSHWDTTGKGSVVNAIDAGKASVDDWNIGAYATAFTPNGTYIDGVIKYNNNEATISAPSHNSFVKGDSLLGSVEVGHSFKQSNNLVIEPQAQATVTRVDWDNISADGSDIKIGDHTYINGRLGVRVEKTINKKQSGEIKPWAYIGVNHEFNNAPNITYGDTKFTGQEYGTVGEGRIGITSDLKDNIAIYGDVGYRSNFDDYESINGHLGVRVKY